MGSIKRVLHLYEVLLYLDLSILKRNTKNTPYGKPVILKTSALG
jgi:hypothetical protein